jgi:ABC-type multidrug transport system ATPase subunit
MKEWRKWCKHQVGFVSQQDHLWPFLSVKETLQIAALLTLPSSFSYSQKMRKARQILKFIELDNVEDVKVGNELKKGISGGQKRRLSTGIELLNAPSILLLDEPTSGLDATSAMVIMQVLRKVADTGRIVIVTIHQPREEIYQLFDQLILLKKGRTVYNGPRSSAASYFAHAGYKCPPDVNACDFFMDVLANNDMPEFVPRVKKEKEMTASIDDLDAVVSGTGKVGKAYSGSITVHQSEDSAATGSGSAAATSECDSALPPVHGRMVLSERAQRPGIVLGHQ